MLRLESGEEKAEGRLDHNLPLPEGFSHTSRAKTYFSDTLEDKTRSLGDYITGREISVNH